MPASSWGCGRPARTNGHPWHSTVADATVELGVRFQTRNGFQSTDRGNAQSPMRAGRPRSQALPSGRPNGLPHIPPSPIVAGGRRPFYAVRAGRQCLGRCRLNGKLRSLLRGKTPCAPCDEVMPGCPPVHAGSNDAPRRRWWLATTPPGISCTPPCPVRHRAPSRNTGQASGVGPADFPTRFPRYAPRD